MINITDDIWLDYIKKCTFLWCCSDEDVFEAKKLVEEIQEVFEGVIPDIGKSLEINKRHSIDWHYDCHEVCKDLRLLGKKLKIHYKGDKQVFINSTVNNTNNNNNINTQNQIVNNTFDFKVELDKVRAEVEADEALDDNVKEEINEKLNEIEEVMNGSLTNNEKWKKLKSTFSWIATKTYKVGQWIIPIITKALFPEE